MGSRPLLSGLYLFRDAFGKRPRKWTRLDTLASPACLLSPSLFALRFWQARQRPPQERGSAERGNPPLPGVSGGVPLKLIDFPRAGEPACRRQGGSNQAHVAAMTLASPIAQRSPTIPCDGRRTARPSGWETPPRRLLVPVSIRRRVVSPNLRNECRESPSKRCWCTIDRGERVSYPPRRAEGCRPA